MPDVILDLSLKQALDRVTESIGRNVSVTYVDASVTRRARSRPRHPSSPSTTMSSAAKGKAPANGSTSALLYELPWYVPQASRTSPLPQPHPRVEKYRPHVLDDVVGNTDTIERLKVIARDGNCPHIIISVSIVALRNSLSHNVP